MPSRKVLFDFPCLLALLSAFISLDVAADKYNIVKEYSGTNFFNDWVFYDHYDNLTNGDAIFVSASQAASSKLAFVDPTTNHAIIKVDNTSTVVFNYKRDTVRIQTSDLFSVGSVWTADILHVPYGHGVLFHPHISSCLGYSLIGKYKIRWSSAPAWPTGGEIDTFEGVNLATHNLMGLHTLPGCTQVSPKQSSTLIDSTDCSYLHNGNQGCTTTDPSTASYGAGFARAGGGVFVTEYAATGISVWFFSRSNVPSVLSSNSSTIDTSTFGLPVGNWPATGCASSTFFEPQNLVFDITLCGGFAGVPSIFAQTCSGVCYNDYVVGNGSNYAMAYFEVASVRVFSKAGTDAFVSTSSSRSRFSFGEMAFGGSLSVTGLGALAVALWWMAL
ncbi:glycoside hydrolase family 16 protein [Phlegmacium glaucopus]|nr:glycoside hydrolase family 16 protein [Phlegmacium glaucopus]